MKRTIAAAFLALCLAVTGCGRGPDEVSGDFATEYENLAAILEEIKTDDDAKKGASRIETVGKRLGELRDEAEKLRVTKKRKEELRKKYEPRRSAAKLRLRREVARLARTEEGRKVVAQVMEIAQQLTGKKTALDS